MNHLAPSGGIKEQLGTIFKQIREAQTLDVHGDEMVTILRGTTAFSRPVLNVVWL